MHAKRIPTIIALFLKSISIDLDIMCVWFFAFMCRSHAAHLPSEEKVFERPVGRCVS